MTPQEYLIVIRDFDHWRVGDTIEGEEDMGRALREHPEKVVRLLRPPENEP